MEACTLEHGGLRMHLDSWFTPQDLENGRSCWNQGKGQRAKKGHNRYKLPLLGNSSAASMLTPGEG